MRETLTVCFPILFLPSFLALDIAPPCVTDNVVQYIRRSISTSDVRGDADLHSWYISIFTETANKEGMWLRDISSCCCLTTAGKIKQLMLNKIYIPFLPSLYSGIVNFRSRHISSMEPGQVLYAQSSLYLPNKDSPFPWQQEKMTRQLPDLDLQI